MFSFLQRLLPKSWRSDAIVIPVIRLHGTIMPETPPKPIGTGLHSAPSRRALVLALCLIAAFALGYVAGVTSVGTPSVGATAP